MMSEPIALGPTTQAGRGGAPGTAALSGTCLPRLDAPLLREAEERGLHRILIVAQRDSSEIGLREKHFELNAPAADGQLLRVSVTRKLRQANRCPTRGRFPLRH